MATLHACCVGAALCCVVLSLFDADVPGLLQILSRVCAERRERLRSLNPRNGRKDLRHDVRVSQYDQIARVATALHDTWHVERLAPGHCSGEPTFAHFKKVWGTNYVYAGVGTVIEMPSME